MLDKGFEDDIKLILGSCPDKEQRQTLMFTATWPRSVQGLAAGFMKSPVRIAIGGERGNGSIKQTDGELVADDGETNNTEQLRANRRISQHVEVVDPRQRSSGCCSC